MKLTNVVLGLGVGITTGIVVAYYRKNTQQSFIKDNEAEIERMKQNAAQIKDYVAQIKNESMSYASQVTDDVKDILGSFKADIQPNIERLQGNIENIQNRVTEITEGPAKNE